MYDEDDEDEITEDKNVGAVTSSIQGSSRSDGCHIQIENLKHGELQDIEAMLMGRVWVSVATSGRLIVRDRFTKPPTPIEDPMEACGWQLMGAKGQTTFAPSGMDIITTHHLTNYHKEPIKGHCGAQITIQHLCGYNYETEADYIRNAERLVSYGFVCCRSPRGRDGRRWEVWLLPGLWMAKGGLKDALDKEKKRKGQFDVSEEAIHYAVGYLCHTVEFGTLDVSVQRAAMVME